MENIFTDIYERCVWGNNCDNSYKGSSGEGSDVNYNKDTYIPVLKTFIKENGVKTVVDLGCGDFRCGSLIYDDLDVTYVGYDAYEKVVKNNGVKFKEPKYKFIHLDFCGKKNEIVGGDVCILKDVIQHWELEKIYEFLDYIVETKKFKYILITNCCQQEQDNTTVTTGGFRPLSCNYLPLKKYGAEKLYNYDTKELSVIRL